MTKRHAEERVAFFEDFAKSMPKGKDPHKKIKIYKARVTAVDERLAKFKDKYAEAGGLRGGACQACRQGVRRRTRRSSSASRSSRSSPRPEEEAVARAEGRYRGHQAARRQGR